MLIHDTKGSPMLDQKIESLKTGRLMCDILTVLVIAIYGGIAWVAYPLSLLTSLNMAVCTVMLGVVIFVTRLRINRLLKSLQAKGSSK
jgi:hypothetical protein